MRNRQVDGLEHRDDGQEGRAGRQAIRDSGEPADLAVTGNLGNYRIGGIVRQGQGTSMGIFLALLAISAGLMVTGLVAAVVFVRRGVRHLLGWAEQNQLVERAKVQLLEGAQSSSIVRQVTGTSAYRYIDPDEATAWQILSVVRPMRHDDVLGPYANAIITSVDKIDFYRDAFDQVLEHEFGSTSLTWVRFHAPVEETLHEVVATSTRMANRMQVFDSCEYRQLRRQPIPEGTTEADRLQVMTITLGNLDVMRDSVLRMMSGLERLHSELTQLSVSHAQGDCDMLLDEISRLAGEAKLYV